MQIAITKPGEAARFLDMDNYTVQLSGLIESGDASRLEGQLKSLQAPGRIFSFYLHSPGGNLMEGMRLGRVIRKYGLTTYVGRYRGEGEKSLSGHCYSACSLSFLGGSYRYVNEGSSYGVHRLTTLDGKMVDLSARELSLLEVLLQRAGRPVSKDQLVERLCGWGEEVSLNAIEVYIHRLRKKIEKGPVRVATVRGLGCYYLEKISA
ncbi:Transcriptional regulatory protein, C terminal [Variovorax sp. CF079]|uniref:winged helix-turn-helix domain-containing protein n=1 Tax=Variovorax sp. CF079 TaxID=1882774 RepID=UPI00088783FB|nr:winged helix-turn-helix domain-containing protein [Variovorax sp. CF079]SDE95636.1 Transcriptional regulatory protein, C terminal [Variovorax sp. CF079]